MVVVTSPLTLARLLWLYGEDDLWELALALPPEKAADIGERAGDLMMHPGAADAIWPERPRGSELVLVAIEALAGGSPPARRNRRKPKKNLPARLNATETELWSSIKPVSDVVDQRNRDRH